MSQIKQVIVMRTDTNPPMRKGKMIAQGAHASMLWYRDLVQNDGSFTGPEISWLDGDEYAKVCVRVDSEKELMAIAESARIAGVKCFIVQDLGKTEFKEPTITCLALGPDYAEKIDAITGHLKLL